MVDGSLTFRAVRSLIRAIPDRLRGKSRLARMAARPFRHLQPILIPDRYGNRLWCPSVRETIAASLFASGAYEPGTLAAILGALKSNGVYVDVGANIGALSLPVAAIRPDAKIICVEADPNIAALLRRNVAENERTNITVVELLAGAANDMAVPFYRAPEDKFGMGSIGAQFDAPPIPLAQRPLDEVLDELGLTHIHVLKLDIEGGELGALRGLARRLADEKAPTVIFEFTDWAEARIPGQAPGDAQKFMLSHRYQLFRLRANMAPPVPLERPITKGAAMILACPSSTIL